MAKGGNFERTLCRLLSVWWCGEDDAFWRSSQSGGMATTRRKKGKKTRGHAGDIAATDSEGEPLVKLITFEAKVGYYDADVFRLFDKPAGCGKTWFKWITQARRAANAAGTPYWAIIHLRNKRGGSHVPLIAIPDSLVQGLLGVGCYMPTALLLDQFSLLVLRLNDFLDWVDPMDIKLLLEKHNDKG